MTHYPLDPPTYSTHHRIGSPAIATGGDPCNDPACPAAPHYCRHIAAGSTVGYCEACRLPIWLEPWEIAKVAVSVRAWLGRRGRGRWRLANVREVDPATVMAVCRECAGAIERVGMGTA